MSKDDNFFMKKLNIKTRAVDMMKRGCSRFLCKLIVELLNSFIFLCSYSKTLDLSYTLQFKLQSDSFNKYFARNFEIKYVRCSLVIPEFKQIKVDLIEDFIMICGKNCETKVYVRVLMQLLRIEKDQIANKMQQKYLTDLKYGQWQRSCHQSNFNFLFFTQNLQRLNMT